MRKEIACVVKHFETSEIKSKSKENADHKELKIQLLNSIVEGLKKNSIREMIRSSFFNIPLKTLWTTK